MKTKTLRKSILAFCIIAAMIFSYVPAVNPAIATVDAATVEKSNVVDAEGYKFDLYDDGTATVKGYSGSASNMVIPSTYTLIGEGENPDKVYQVTAVGGSFITSADPVSLTIPEGVKTIGDYSLDGFSSLKTVSLPDSLESVGVHFLYGCESLESLTIPKNLKSIGPECFVNGVNMNISVAPGNTAFKVVDNALYNADMTKLYYAGPTEKLVIPDSVTTIAEEIFMNRGGIKNIVMPDTIPELHNQMFNGCSDLETIKLPAGITSIPGSTFKNCTKLKSVEIPAGVTSIGSHAFNGCAMTELKLPKGLTSIDQQAFRNCTNLKTLTIPASVTTLPRGFVTGCSSLEYLIVLTKDATLNRPFNWMDAAQKEKMIIMCEPGSTIEAEAKNNNITVVSIDPLAITTEKLADGTVGAEYSQKLESTGTPVPEWSVVQGELPAGLTLNAKGELTGTPEAAGEYTFTVEAYNGKALTKEFTIVIKEAPASGGDDADKNDKDNKDDATQTGDDANMASMFALMIAALITAGAAVVRRKEN